MTLIMAHWNDLLAHLNGTQSSSDVSALPSMTCQNIRHVKRSAMLACACDVKPINSSWTVHCNFPAGDVIRPAGLPTNCLLA